MLLSHSIQPRTKHCFLKASTKLPNTSPKPFYCKSSKIRPDTLSYKCLMVPHSVRSFSLWWVIYTACLTNGTFLVVFGLEDVDWSGGSTEIQMMDSLLWIRTLNTVIVHISEVPCVSLFDMHPVQSWKVNSCLIGLQHFIEAPQHWVYFLFLGIRSPGIFRNPIWFVLIPGKIVLEPSNNISTYGLSAVLVSWILLVHKKNSIGRRWL